MFNIMVFLLVKNIYSSAWANYLCIFRADISNFTRMIIKFEEN